MNEQTDLFFDMPGHLLRRCHQIAVGLFHDQCKRFNITPLQYAVLSALSHYGELDQVSLGGIVALDRTTTAHVITRLLQRDLLTRHASQTDKRFKIVQITDSGKKLLEQVRPTVDGVQEAIVAPLGESEVETLVSLLQKIAEGNNAYSRAPKKIAS